MIKVFFGNDYVAVRKEAFSCIDQALKTGKQLTTIEADAYVPSMFTDLSGGVSLFGVEQVYVIDTPSSKKDFYEDTVSNLPLLAESPHLFVIIEDSLLAPEKKKFSKYAEDMFEAKVAAGERFNTFSLTDALARKDKKGLWLLLHEAKLSGIALEEIIGVLWWQLKTLRLAACTENASEAGMKDYPYNKAKRSLGTFQAGELEKLSHSLLQLTHDSRLGKRELDVALEHWMLTL